MKIDTGMVVVIAAVLFFYLRLIGMQRERARRATLALARPPREARKKSRTAAAPTPVFSILSPSRLDRWIAGAGAVLVLLGVALNAKWIPLASIQPYWWIPTALGVLGFSWAFKVPREIADA